jgi:hypothetical protein
VAASTTRKQGSTTAPPRAGLCYRFICWDARTGDHTLEYVLCFRCQHSLFFGIDLTRQPRKKTGPGRRKSDPDVVLDPVALPCELCRVNGWEPDYEADEMARREREHDEQLAAEYHYQPETPAHFPAQPDEDGQVSLF